jgi:hypothetical protein
MRRKSTKHVHYIYSRDETGRGIRSFKRPRSTSKASGWHAEPLACYPGLPGASARVDVKPPAPECHSGRWVPFGAGRAQCALPDPELRRRGRVIIVHAPAPGRESTLSVRRRGLSAAPPDAAAALRRPLASCGRAVTSWSESSPASGGRCPAASASPVDPESVGPSRSGPSTDDPQWRPARCDRDGGRGEGGWPFCFA